MLHATLCGFHDNKILWFGQGAEPQFMPFQALQEQTKIFRIFCILLQIRNNFQDILCFSRTFSGISDSFSAHSLLSAAQHKTQYLVVCFAPTAMLFSSGTPARRSSPQAEISLEKSVFFAFFPLSKRCKACYNMYRYCGAQARPHRALPACRSMVFDTKEASP